MRALLLAALGACAGTSDPDAVDTDLVVADGVRYTSRFELSSTRQVAWLVAPPGTVAADAVLSARVGDGELQAVFVGPEGSFVSEVDVRLGDVVHVYADAAPLGVVRIDASPPRDGLPDNVGGVQTMNFGDRPEEYPPQDPPGTFHFPIDTDDIGWPLPMWVFNPFSGAVVVADEAGNTLTIGGRDQEMFCVASQVGDAVAMTAAFCSRVIVPEDA